LLYLCIALAALLGACGAPDRAAPPASLAAPTVTTPTIGARNEELYVRDAADGPATSLVLLGDSGQRLRDLPLGALSPDWSLVYLAEQRSAGGKASTHVQAIDLHTGQVAHETTIDGAYELPLIGADEMPGGLAPNGQWLTLRKAAGQPAGQSQFVVLDAAFARTPRYVKLDVDGPYVFDGIDNSGNALFLIQYVLSPSVRPSRYQVRYYDMVRGTLDPQVVVAKGEDEVMAGTHHSSLAAPGGAWLYSLYINNQHGPFIHALSLKDRFALCIDLPASGKDDDAKQMFWALASSPDGRRLYAVNGALGLVAKLDISHEGVPEMLRTAELPPAPSARAGVGQALSALFAPSVAEAKPGHGGPGAAALSADGATLFAIGERGLLAIDTSNLTLRGRYLPDISLAGLAIGASSGQIYVVNSAAGTILNVDAASGKLLGELGGVQRPIEVLRVGEAKKT
jgi:hypothetical protein